MQNSQNKENPEGNEDKRTIGFGIGQAFTAAAASLRAAGTRAQELVEGTTNAVLASLPLSRIRATEPAPASAANNKVTIENQPVNNVLTLANTPSRTNVSLKASCVIKTELAKETAQGTENLKAPVVPVGEATASQKLAGQSELPNNGFFKGSSIVKTNLQLEQAQETTKGTDILKAPAVQTPAGQSELSNIDFFKGSFIIKTDVKQKLAHGTAKVSENPQIPSVAQTEADQPDLPYIDFFNGFSSIDTNICFKQTEGTALGSEHLKTPTAQTTAGQPESRLQLQKVSERAGTSLEPVCLVQSILQSTGTQTDEINESVVKSLIARRHITASKAEAALIRQISNTRRLDVLTQEERAPSFFTEHQRLCQNLARQVSTSSQTGHRLVDTSKIKRLAVSRQPESASDFKTHRMHSNFSQRTEINLIHHRQSNECESQTAFATSTSRRIRSSPGRRISSIDHNFTSHKRTLDASSNDLSLHRRKARRLSEVVDQRRRLSGTTRTIIANQDSRSEIAVRNEVQDRRSHRTPSASLPSMLPLRSEHVRARGWATEGRASRSASSGQRNKFLEAIKQFFGRCAGYRRRH